MSPDPSRARPQKNILPPQNGPDLAVPSRGRLFANERKLTYFAARTASSRIYFTRTFFAVDHFP